MLERTVFAVERSVIMPDEEAMLRALSNTWLPLRQQNVLVRYVSSIARQEETPSTLVAAWQGACQDGTRKFRFTKDKALIHLLNKYSFPGVMDAILPDRKVAAEAKEELQYLTENALTS